MFMMTHVFLAMEDSKIPNEFISENGNPLQQSESYFHKNGFQNCEIFSELIKCCQLPDVAFCVPNLPENKWAHHHSTVSEKVVWDLMNRNCKT